MKHRIAVIGIVCFLLLAACTTPTAQPTATLVFPTAPLPPTSTQSPAITSETTLAPIVTEDIPTGIVLQAFPAKVAVSVINLRTGPGTAHDVLGKFAQDADIAVIGKAQGDEWVLVETPNGQIGWMILVFLTLDTPVEELPTLPVTYSMIVHGSVKDASGTPVDKVLIAVYQQTVAGELRSDDLTDSNGEFYAYLPYGSQGKFSVQIVGVDCASSIMDLIANTRGNLMPMVSPKSPFLPQKALILFTDHSL